VYSDRSSRTFQTCSLPPSSGRWVLMMEAARTSETSVNFYQITRRNIPEGSHIHCNVANIFKTLLWLHFKIILQSTHRFSKRSHLSTFSNDVYVIFPPTPTQCVCVCVCVRARHTSLAS
jgi:hypothetical protein